MQTETIAVPPLDEEVRWILGRPNFMCGHIADLLRHDGHTIARKAEDEQAAVIHWMLALYVEKGSAWRDFGEIKLQEIRDRIRPAAGEEAANNR